MMAIINVFAQVEKLILVMADVHAQANHLMMALARIIVYHALVRLSMMAVGNADAQEIKLKMVLEIVYALVIKLMMEQTLILVHVLVKQLMMVQIQTHVDYQFANQLHISNLVSFIVWYL